MSGLFDILDIAIRSRFATVSDLQKMPIWQQFSCELQTVLLNECELRMLIPKIWQIQNREEAVAGRSICTSDFVSLMLGFLFLAFENGKIELDELLLNSSRYCDRYECNVNTTPFRLMRNGIKSGQIVIDRREVEVAYLPFIESAKSAIAKYGLSIEHQ
jgi:hypothetical protein